jgi:hypothetical protein
LVARFGLTLEDDLEAGRRQWTVAWRRFARQWTQPQLLRLTDSVLGGRYLHSSQISGFATGKLREPSPKVFLAVGRLNQALANSELPSELQILWSDKKFLADRDGNALDAVGCFRAFTGELDLGLGNVRSIPDDQVDEANKRLGRYVRGQLAKAGVDFIEELPDLMAEKGSLAKSVLLGQRMTADDLVEAVPELEALLKTKGIDTNLERLWAIVIGSS